MDIETYNPKKRVGIRKAELMPAAIDVGSKFGHMGPMVEFFISSFFASIRSFFKTKRKVRDFQAKHEKTFDFTGY